MELVIIRHGQSEADLLGVHEGRADFPLTELGRKQAGKMAVYLAENLPPDLILASPLKRASATARVLQKTIGCEIQYYDELKEYNNGVLAGLSKKEAAITHPLPKGGRPVHIPIQDGESELEFRYRAEWMLHHVLHEYRDVRRIAIVSHGGLISNLIKAFLHQPNGKFAFSTGDTGIHLLEQQEDMRFVRFLNRQDHLL